MMIPDRVPLWELPPLHLPELDREKSSEDNFMGDLVEGANFVNQYLVLAAGIVPTASLSKIEGGTLTGHMVRLFKLYDTYLLLIVNNRAEPAFVIQRPMAETLINLRFLLRFGNEEVFQQYQRASLAYEKRLWDEIQSRVHDPVWPIEERMLGSIRRTFERAGVDVAAVSWEHRNWGGDAYQKAVNTDFVGLYEFAFRTASNFVHGTWHEMEFHNLEDKGEYYAPRPDYTVPRPQMIEGFTIASVEVAGEYLLHILGEERSAEIRRRLQEIAAWFHEMSARHETFLQRRCE